MVETAPRQTTYLMCFPFFQQPEVVRCCPLGVFFYRYHVLVTHEKPHTMTSKTFSGFYYDLPLA